MPEEGKGKLSLGNSEHLTEGILRKSKELDFPQRKSRDYGMLSLLHRSGLRSDRWLFHEAGLFTKRTPGVSG